MNANEYAHAISDGLKRLRKDRKITQADLAKYLGLSQAQLSKIERGTGSISAPQLILILQRYSLPLSYFQPPSKNPEADAPLQNALIYLGATQLREVAGTGVPEIFTQPEEAIVATLVTTPSARLITALTPIIVKNCEAINFQRIDEKLKSKGLENRFWWVIEASYLALQERLKEAYLPRDLHRLYQKAFLLLERKKVDAAFLQDKLKEDELDTGLISNRTLEWVKNNRDKLAKHWHIITRIKKEDFLQALRDSEEK